MRTCVVHFGATLVSSAKLHEPEPAKYPNAYANVGEAGELTIMWEINVGTDAEPRYSSRVNAIYAPGTWLSVTYEEA